MAKIIKFVVAIIIALTIGVGTGVLIGESIKKHELQNKYDSIDISDDLSFKSQSIKYDGKAHSIYVVGVYPQSIKITYSNNNKVDVGSYEVVASISDSSNKYTFPKKMSATLTIYPADLDIEFNDATYRYTGSDITHEILNLDSRYTVTYHNNIHKEVGEYEVTAIIHDNTGNYNDLVLISTMTIESGNSYNVYLDDMTVTYSGSEFELLASGMTDKYNITYDNNKHTDAGTYLVKARLTDPQGVLEDFELSATLTILKRDFNITFEDKVVLYDGNAHSLEAEGIPAGMTVNYSQENFVEVGEHEITLTVTDPNHNYNDFTSTKILTISNELVLSMDSLRIVKDGNGHMTEVVGTLPTGVNITYYNADTNEIITSLTDVGTYNIRAEVVDTLNRYQSKTLNAVLTIVDGFKTVFRYDGIVVATYYVEKGTPVTKYPDLPVEEGYVLSWQLEGTANLEAINKNLAFNIVRSRKEYNIIYVTDYDTSTLPQSYYYNTSTIILDPLEVEGYVFAGWYTEIEHINLVEDIDASDTGDITLYPYLVPMTYKANYYVNNVLYKSALVTYNNPFRLETYTNNTFKAIMWHDAECDDYYNSGELIDHFVDTHDVRFDAIIVDPNYLFDVTLKNNNKLTLDTYKGSSVSGDENIYIPSYYLYESQWIAVDEIGANAFKNYANKNNIQRVVVPSGIKIIGDNAFEGLTNLKDVELSTSVTNIGSKAFYNCSSLEDVNLANVTLIKISAFEGCLLLEEVDLRGLSVIPDSAFESSGINKIYIKGNISILEGAFEGAGALYVYYDGTKEEFDALSVPGLPVGYILYCLYNGSYVLQ